MIGFYDKGFSLIDLPVESTWYDLGRQAIDSAPVLVAIKSTGLLGGARAGDAQTESAQGANEEI